jgi:heptosyltransferase-2
MREDPGPGIGPKAQAEVRGGGNGVTRPRALERILIRIPNWLGDVMLARPLLHGLRAAHPGARLLGAGPAGLIALLVADRALDRGEAWPAGPEGRAGARRRIAEFRPEIAVVLPPSFSSALFAWRTRAPVRIGYRGEGRSIFLTHAPARPARGELHLSREFLALGATVGVAEVALPRLGLTPDSLAAARALRTRHGLADGERHALMAPRSAWGPAREWPPERFAEVGRRLVALGLRVLVCGTAAERADCERVAAHAGAGAVSIAGETGLAELAALATEAAVAVCNDSGLAHVTAATHAPTIQIYGSASSAWTHALGPRVRVVQRAPVCSPCYQRTCRIGYGCLTAIGVEEIVRVAREIAA